MKKITDALQRTVITGAPTDDGAKMIQQLKEKFREIKRRSEQLQVLTVLPKSWLVKKVQQEFGVSEYLARQSKKLVVFLVHHMDLHCHQKQFSLFLASMNPMTSVA